MNHVQFTTNLDACKRMMGNVSGLPLSSINPQVNDLVRVYHDAEFDLYLKVVSRKWEMTNGGNPVLVCELHLPDYFETISALEGCLLSRGFRW